MDKNDQLFMQLLFIFHQSGMQALGKIKNPITDKVERNLEQASNAIEMLEMLQTKTKGNISAELDKMMTGFLTDLRLNFVDESSKN